MSRLTFFFDYLSPYAYLAWPRAKALCTERNLDLRPEPVLLAGLLSHWGQLGPAEIPPKKVFTFKDAYRRAHEAGLPLEPPATHPFRPLTALRASQASVAADQQVRIIDALFGAAWASGIEMSDDRAIASALTAAGLDGERLVAAAGESSSKDALKSGTEKAVTLGVFGVPTFYVEAPHGVELFWGQDRVRDVEAFLDGRDPARSVASLQRSPSSERRR